MGGLQTGCSGGSSKGRKRRENGLNVWRVAKGVDFDGAGGRIRVEEREHDEFVEGRKRGHPPDGVDVLILGKTKDLEVVVLGLVLEYRHC